MNLPEQLRAVADRLEEAERWRLAALAALHDLLDGEAPTIEQGAESAIREDAAGAGIPDPAPPPGESAGHACPECGDVFATRQGVGVHRRHKHGHRADWRDQPGQPSSPARTTTSGRLMARDKGRAALAEPLRAHTYSYGCDRCERFFPSKQERDAHQLTHPKVPVGKPVGRAPGYGAIRASEDLF